MLNRPNFIIIPWQHDFMRSLLDMALADGTDLENALFIFPHARPSRYMENLIRHNKALPKPCLLPNMLSVHDLFARLAANLPEIPVAPDNMAGSTAGAGNTDAEDESATPFMRAHAAKEASTLDKVALLLECARALAENEKDDGESGGLFSRPTLTGQQALREAGAFFPWGLRLADLFEDCFYNNVTPQTFYQAEYLVEPFAAALLANLGELHKAYVQALRANGLATPGLNAFRVARAVTAPKNASPSGHAWLAGNKFLSDRRIYIAGFHSPSGTEKTLFTTLWQEMGAKICLHADPALLDGKGHWSCAPLNEWIKDFNSKSVIHAPDGIAEKTPRISYYAGYDLHAQLAVMHELLLEGGKQPGPASPAEHSSPAAHSDRAKQAPSPARERVIVLPDAALLAPTLHHLPDTDFNVSMGYPLGRSTLFRLLDDILNLQERRREGGYYWRDRLNLVRHPYIKMLRPLNDRQGEAGQAHDAEPGANFLRRALHRLEQHWRANRSYLGLDELLGNLELNIFLDKPVSNAEAALLRKIFRVCITDWEDCFTLADCAQRLEALCALLIEHGGGLWESFRIDAECLRRLLESVVPGLRDTRLGAEALPKSTIFSLLRQLFTAERAPFEAYPLTGLQVMGLLESRLLRFDEVFILNAVDNLLPGSPPVDPLLPDTLRRSLGLPDALRKQRLAAYYFFRLLAGAEKAHIFWQEGSESGKLQEGKRLKSRFIEELLWQEEQKTEPRRILNPEKAGPAGSAGSAGSSGRWGMADGPLHTLACPTRPINSACRNVEKTPAIAKLLLQATGKHLSASFLDAYLTCPLRFYYQYIYGQDEVAEVNEGEDPRAVGDLFHAVLKNFYAPRLGRPLTAEDLTSPAALKELDALFITALRNNDALLSLPADSLAMLKIAGPRRLRRFLENQPPSRPLLLEENFLSSLPLPEWLGKKLPALPAAGLSLRGRLDRVDLRQNQQDQQHLVVLDYKTGHIKSINHGLWFESKFWDKLEASLAAEQNQEVMDAIFATLRDAAPSLQLPVYLHLLADQNSKAEGNLALQKACLDHTLDAPPDAAPPNAALVELRDEGKEYFLFSPPQKDKKAQKGKEDKDGMADDDIFMILEKRIPALLSFTATHMLNSGRFDALEGPACAYCTACKLCRIQI